MCRGGFTDRGGFLLKRFLVPAAVLLGAAALLGFFLIRPALPPALVLLSPPVPSPLAVWPWPRALRESPHFGVTHWLDTSSPDGASLDFFDFDLKANPRLRFEIYDQDEDDAHPFDDRADCWPHGVGWAMHHLNTMGRGAVVAAWHGLFFNGDARGAVLPTLYVGHHVTPVVLNGCVHANVGQARWTFGVRYDAQGRPTFSTLLMPDKKALAHSFTYAAGGAQCLIRDGRPLRLRPFPTVSVPPPPQPVPCGPGEAGYIPNVDWIQTSRATMAWSRDQTHFYLLFVKQTGIEGGAVMASHGHGPPTGGWTVSDAQRFWLAHGAWGAINSGDLAQLTYLQPDGDYVLLPPIAQQRLLFTPDFVNAPAHGALLYFYVRDTSAP